MARARTVLAGVSGVPVTPYRGDGSVDAALLGKLTGRIAAASVHNIVAAGNTGEFYALTPGEIDRVHDTTIEAVHGAGGFVTAAIGRSLVEAIATGKRAAAAGADAAMAHQPLDPFAAPQAQAGYFLALADALPLPLVVYLRSDAIAVADLVKLAAHPNVAGVKFATPNLALLQTVLRESPAEGAIWVCGLAESWAAAFHAVGARGFTSGLVNVDPARSLAVHAHLERGDYPAANAAVAAIAPFEAMRARHANGANVTVVKEALTRLGWPVGPVRLPGLPALDAAARAELAAILDGWGLLKNAA